MIMNIIILETNHTLNKQTFVLTNLYKEKNSIKNTISQIVTFICIKTKIQDYPTTNQRII